MRDDEPAAWGQVKNKFIQKIILFNNIFNNNNNKNNNNNYTYDNNYNNNYFQ